VRIASALLAIGLLALSADRALGLTAFAVAPGAGLLGGDGTFGPASVVADLTAVLLVVLALLASGTHRWLRPRRLAVGSMLVAALIALQVGEQVASIALGVPFVSDLYLARAMLLTGSLLSGLRVVTALGEHRATTERLQAATVTAQSLAAAGRDELLRLRAEVSDQVRDILGEAVDSLAEHDHQGSGERLRRLARDVLRPLSHRLATAPVTSAPPSMASPQQERWRDTMAAVWRTPVLPSRSLALIAGGLAWLRSVVTDQETVRRLAPVAQPRVDEAPAGIGLTIDWAPAVLVLLELGLLVAITWTVASRISLLLERDDGRLRPSAAWSAAIVGLAGIAGLVLLVPLVAGSILDDTPSIGGPLDLFATFVPLLAVTLGSTVTRAVERGRGALERELAVQRALAERAAARSQAILGHEQQRLARALHADVQSAVNAASLMLDRAARDDLISEGLIDEAADRVAAAVERFLGSASSDRPLLDRLGEIVDLWGGVCRIAIEADGDVATRVDADPVTRELVVDLVAEACANAVVHGGASEVVVRLSVTQEVADDVRLIVTDDGVRRSEASGPSVQAGLGSVVLRASCSSFALDLGASGATLTAHVPLAESG
jgi:signal transduction histidine kinase